MFPHTCRHVRRTVIWPKAKKRLQVLRRDMGSPLDLGPTSIQTLFAGCMLYILYHTHAVIGQCVLTAPPPHTSKKVAQGLFLVAKQHQHAKVSKGKVLIMAPAQFLSYMRRSCYVEWGPPCYINSGFSKTPKGCGGDRQYACNSVRACCCYYLLRHFWKLTESALQVATVDGFMVRVYFSSYYSGCYCKTT